MEQDLKKDNIALNNKKFSRELSKTANMKQVWLFSNIKEFKV